MRLQRVSYVSKLELRTAVTHVVGQAPSLRRASADFGYNFRSHVLRSCSVGFHQTRNKLDDDRIFRAHRR